MNNYRFKEIDRYSIFLLS